MYSLPARIRRREKPFSRTQAISPIAADQSGNQAFTYYRIVEQFFSVEKFL
jgi:hypothetical protein